MLPIMFTMDEPDGQSNILVKLYRQYHLILFQKAKEYVQNDQDAEDILQDAFESVLAHLDRLLSIPPEKQVAYLHSTVRNKSYNHLKAKKRALPHLFEGDPEEAIEQFEGSPSPETLFLIHERQASLRQIWDKLSEEEQILLEGKYYLDQSAQELGRVLGIKPTAVATRLMRLRAKVLRLLEEESLQDV